VIVVILKIIMMKYNVIILGLNNVNLLMNLFAQNHVNELLVNIELMTNFIKSSNVFQIIN